MKELATHLKDYLKQLKKRADLELLSANVGKKASKKAVEKLEGFPPDLLAFYSFMDGVHIEWNFIELRHLGGCLNIPSLNELSNFEDDAVLDTNFGHDYEALVIDQHRPEARTYLVKNKQEGSFSYRFVVEGEGEKGSLIATSFAEYLEQAMNSAFLNYWPIAKEDKSKIDAVDFETASAKISGPPVKPAAIRPGVRVELNLSSLLARGEIVELKNLREGTRNAEYNLDYLGAILAKIQLDDGSVFWHPIKNELKVVKKKDLYETRLANKEALSKISAGNYKELIKDLLRAIGPGIYSQGIPLEIGTYENVILGTSLFSNYSIEEAFEYVLDLYDKCVAKGADFAKKISFKPLGNEVNVKAFKTTKSKAGAYTYTLDTAFKSFFDVLTVLLAKQSATDKILAGKVLNESLRGRVPKNSMTENLQKILTTSEILTYPKWHPQWNEFGLIVS